MTIVPMDMVSSVMVGWGLMKVLGKMEENMVMVFVITLMVRRLKVDGFMTCFNYKWYNNSPYKQIMCSSSCYFEKIIYFFTVFNKKNMLLFPKLSIR